MIKMKITYMIYSMYEKDVDNLNDEITYEYEGENIEEIFEMVFDDEIDFADKIKAAYKVLESKPSYNRFKKAPAKRIAAKKK